MPYYTNSTQLFSKIPVNISKNVQFLLKKGVQNRVLPNIFRLSDGKTVYYKIIDS